MQGVTHREVTKAVLLSMLPPMLHQYAEEAAGYASLPDELDDVMVGRFGSKIVGLALCSLTHFQVETTAQHFRGYSWRMDKSLSCWRKWDPRIGDVRCDPRQWANIVGPADAMRHPLSTLISDLRGKATLDADNFTFPCAGSMVEWMWKPWSSVTFSGEPSAIVVGCVIHLIQDMLRHHAKGWLGNGHARFEQQMQDVWSGSNQSELLRTAARLINPDEGPLTPRGIVEAAARIAGKTPNDKPEDALVLGIAWTRAFVTRCLLPAM